MKEKKIEKIEREKKYSYMIEELRKLGEPEILDQEVIKFQIIIIGHTYMINNFDEKINH